jgi:O-antigen ligase/GR25 family glycosyltransferase involved in LPS biosynthesis
LIPSPRSRHTVNQCVDAVFVLSVKTFHDRIGHIESELKRHGIAFEWIFEHDADELTPDQIDAVFAPSDLKRGHQSLVLKHIETWKRCVERGYRRVLVFEDDAVLARDFERVFALAMDEADRVDRPYMVYLGCGDNKYVAGARSAPTMLLTPDIELPATDATVLDRRAAELRLAYVAARKVTRPADWLMREADAAMGVTQYWLREPIVEQGSMNGRFTSVLDDRRTDRGRRWNWLRFRWDRWRRRTLGSTRPEEARIDAGDARATVRRDIWAISVARFAAALTAIGAFVVPGVASVASGVMVLALLAAPSRWQRLKHAFSQPLGQASLLVIAVLGLAIAWSPLDVKAALRAWIGWRPFLWLFVALALFETRRSKMVFMALFAFAATLTACISIGAWLAGVPVHADPVAPYVVFRNHVTQAMAFAAGALFAAVLALQPETGHRRRAAAWVGAAVLAISLVATTPGRSGYIVMAIVAIALAMTQWRGRARMLATAGVLAALVVLAVASPVVLERFERGIGELRSARQSSELTSMGIRVVIWENTRALIAEAPLLGHGLGSFAREYPRFAAKYGSGWQATPSEDPHNQYLYFLAETGVLGLLAFGWWLLAAARQPVTGPCRVAGLALLLAWCVTSLFSSHFRTFNEGHMIMMFLGVLLAREAGLQASSRPSTAAVTSS